MKKNYSSYFQILLKYLETISGTLFIEKIDISKEFGHALKIKSGNGHCTINMYISVEDDFSFRADDPNWPIEKQRVFFNQIIRKVKAELTATENGLLHNKQRLDFYKENIVELNQTLKTIKQIVDNPGIPGIELERHLDLQFSKHVVNLEKICIETNPEDYRKALYNATIPFIKLRLAIGKELRLYLYSRINSIKLSPKFPTTKSNLKSFTLKYKVKQKEKLRDALHDLKTKNYIDHDTSKDLLIDIFCGKKMPLRGKVIWGGDKYEYSYFLKELKDKAINESSIWKIAEECFIVLDAPEVSHSSFRSYGSKLMTKNPTSAFILDSIVKLLIPPFST